MNSQRNILLGAALAALCLTPTAWADASVVLQGQAAEHARSAAIATEFTQISAAGLEVPKLVSRLALPPAHAFTKVLADFWGAPHGS
ncbi:MAG: hypothetical protein WBQ17_15200 [Rhizomicrobium sp.]